MKKLLGLMALLTLCLGFFSSCDDDDDNNNDDFGLASNCDVSSSVSDDYKDDALRLALRYQLQGGPAANEIQIPQALVDRMMGAISAVHKSEFVVRDTVIDIYKVHTTAYPSFEQLSLEVDTSFAWVKEWQSGNRLTGNSEVDALMNIYALDITNFFSLSLGSLAIIEPSEPLNLIGLADAFSSIEGVVSADAGAEAEDGNDIAVVDNGTFLELTFSVGYDSPLNVGECTGDCDFRRSWVFQVNESCQASFINSYGDPAP